MNDNDNLSKYAVTNLEDIQEIWDSTIVSKPLVFNNRGYAKETLDTTMGKRTQPATTISRTNILPTDTVADIIKEKKHNDHQKSTVDSVTEVANQIAKSNNPSLMVLELIQSITVKRRIMNLPQDEELERIRNEMMSRL